MTVARREPLERFMEKVVPDHDSGCWLWMASLGPGRYGQFKFAPKGMIRAHRWAYEQFVGPIPEGLQLDHLCRVRHCVNPAHLEAVTQRENILRGEAVSARNARKTHCDYGHPLAGDNLIVLRRGERLCRTCRTRRNAARYRNNGGPMPCVVCGEEFIASRAGCKFCSMRCKNAARYLDLEEIAPDPYDEAA